MIKALPMKVPRGTGQPDRDTRAACGATDLALQDALNLKAVPEQRSSPCVTIPPTYSGRDEPRLRFETVIAGGSRRAGREVHHF